MLGAARDGDGACDLAPVRRAPPGGRPQGRPTSRATRRSGGGHGRPAGRRRARCRVGGAADGGRGALTQGQRAAGTRRHGVPDGPGADGRGGRSPCGTPVSRPRRGRRALPERTSRRSRRGRGRRRYRLGGPLRTRVGEPASRRGAPRHDRPGPHRYRRPRAAGHGTGSDPGTRKHPDSGGPVVVARRRRGVGVAAQALHRSKGSGAGRHGFSSPGLHRAAAPDAGPARRRVHHSVVRSSDCPRRPCHSSPRRGRHRLRRGQRQVREVQPDQGGARLADHSHRGCSAWPPARAGRDHSHGPQIPLAAATADRLGLGGALSQRDETRRQEAGPWHARAAGGGATCRRQADWSGCRPPPIAAGRGVSHRPSSRSSGRSPGRRDAPGHRRRAPGERTAGASAGHLCKRDASPHPRCGSVGR